MTAPTDSELLDEARRMMRRLRGDLADARATCAERRGWDKAIRALRRAADEYGVVSEDPNVDSLRAHADFLAAFDDEAVIAS